MKRSPLTLAVAFVLIIVFGLLLFTYQVRKSEVAVVTLFGKIVREKPEPGRLRPARDASEAEGERTQRYRRKLRNGGLRHDSTMIECSEISR